MMQQPAGIAALPQQQQPQMPGQAPGIQQALPQMQPQAGGKMSAPQSFVSPLTQQAMPQLLQEFNNPQSRYPKFAVLAAMKERQEKERMQQAMQGQAAMGQAQQQQGSVADDVVAQAQAGQELPVMAAHGGIMQGYADGGPVAFARGGVSQEFGDSPEAFAMDELRIREAQIAKKRAEDRARYEFLKDAAPEVAARMATENPELAIPSAPPAPPRPPAPTVLPPAIPPSFAPPQGGSGMPPLAGAARTAGPARPALTAAPQDDEMARLYADRVAQARARAAAGEPAELTAASKGIADLIAKNLATQQAEATTFGEESRAAREAALARANRPMLEDPRALLSLAAGIDTRRGRGVGSLAGTAAGLMGQKEAAAEAARREYGAAQREQRGMQANVRQAQILELQRQQLLMKGKFDEALKLEKEINDLLMGGAEYKTKRGDVAFQQGIQLRGAKTEETKAAAALEAARSRPETAMQRRQLTYDQAEANVAKFMESIGGMQEISRIQKIAKEANQPIPSVLDIRKMLIAQELQSGGGTAPVQAPSVQLPASALSQLKEGVVTSFANGQQWTLENGQPKRVK